MITKQLYDKSQWPEGRWLHEPDFATWIDENTMYTIVMQRLIFGAWAGYVGIPPTHPLYLTPKSEHTYEFLDVHGQIEFAGISSTFDLASTPPIRRWWIGFHCMEVNDLCPASLIPQETAGKYKRVYRDFSYVRLQVESLSSQLATIDMHMTYFDESI